MIIQTRITPKVARWAFSIGYFETKGEIKKITDTFISGITNQKEKFVFELPYYFDIALWLYRNKKEPFEKAPFPDQDHEMDLEEAIIVGINYIVDNDLIK